MKKCIATIVAVFLMAVSVRAQSVADPVINKLIEKGIIEPHEAQEIRNEVAKELRRQFDEQKAKEDEEKKKDKYKLRTRGYMQIMYTVDESTTVTEHPGKYRDPIYIRRARIGFSQQITDWIGFNITPEFAKCADPLEVTDSSVVSSTSPVRFTTVSRVRRVPVVELKNAYIELTFHSLANFRLGQFIIPFGFENVYSSSKKIFPSDAVQYMRNVLPSDYDYGIRYSLDYKKLISFEIAALNGTTHHRENNNKKDISAKLAVSLDLFTHHLKGIEISGSYYDRHFGEITTTTVTPINGQHYNAYLKVEREIFIPVFLTLEYVWGKNSTLTRDVENIIATLEIKPLEKTFLKGFAPSFRYEMWDPNTSVSNNELEVYSFGINYYPDKNVRFLVDYRIPKEKPSDIINNRLNLMAQVSF